MLKWKYGEIQEKATETKNRAKWRNRERKIYVKLYKTSELRMEWKKTHVRLL